jgi:Protein of unknown function (DUF3027)
MQSDTGPSEGARISMTALPLSRDAFQALVQPLIGLAVSLPWNGYGTVIFLELGQLSPSASKQRYGRGEACIHASRGWRMECGASVLYGSSNRKPAINRGLASLQGARLETGSLVGEVPELVAVFSNGHCLRSMVMLAGDPAWCVRLPDGNTLSIDAGALCVGDGRYEATPEEKAAFARAEAASLRWGTPSAEPRPGQCMNCRWFVPIDGDGQLLDYGICSADTSPFNGRAVNRESGCPSFIAAQAADPGHAVTADSRAVTR